MINTIKWLVAQFRWRKAKPDEVAMCKSEYLQDRLGKTYPMLFPCICDYCTEQTRANPRINDQKREG